jgi:small GTP-binding protein
MLANNMKLILLGAPGVGKTALVTSFTERGPFSEESRSTIGVDFYSCVVAVGDENVRLQIWDTAGQERFRSLQAQYYRGSDAVLLTYDVTDAASLVALNGWAEDVRVACKVDPVICVVGNKSDLASARKVTLEEAREHGRAIGAADVFEVSAKDGANVRTAFEQLITMAWRTKRTAMELQQSASEKGAVLLDVPRRPQSSLCCQL